MLKRSAVSLVVCTVCAACLLLVLLPARVAASGDTQQTTPSLRVTGNIYPDETVGVAGFGFTAGEMVNLYFDGQLDGSAKAIQGLTIHGSQIGRLAASLVIPDSALSGPHTISAVGQSSGFSEQATVTVLAPWRQSGFTAAGGAYNNYETAISPSNVGTLAQYWTWTDPNQYSLLYNAPSVMGNVLYMGTSDGDFHAFSTTTGTQLWSTPLETDFNGQAAVTDTTVYTTGFYLEALNASNGSVLWDTSTFSSNNGDTFLDPPTLANGIIYVGSGEYIFAFSANGCGQAHCSPLWMTTNNGQNLDTTPVIANNVMYAVSSEGTLFAYNATNGQALWSAVTTLNIYGRPPIVSNGVVYVASEDGHLYAFDANGCGASTCSPLWTGTMSGSIVSVPALANGVVYVGSNDDNLYAFDANGCGASTCSPLWTATTGGQVGAPAVANGVVYAGSYDDSIYAYAAAGCGESVCSPLWSYATANQVWSAPIVDNGILYFSDHNQTLYAFHLPGTSIAQPHGSVVRPAKHIRPALPNRVPSTDVR